MSAVHSDTLYRVRAALLGGGGGTTSMRSVITQDDAATGKYDLSDAIGVELTRADGALARLGRHIDPQQHTGGPPHGLDYWGDRGHWDTHTHTRDGRPESAASFAAGIAVGAATTYVVGRPDLDSIAAIAVLEILFWAPSDDRSAVEATIAPRVEAIRAADCHRDRGPWAPYPLDANHLWPPTGAVQDTALLGPIASICSPMGTDPVLPLAERVAIVAGWLLTGEERGPVADARARIERERAALIARHEIEVYSEGHTPIAVVRSNEAGAIGLGYSRAPIVVAYAPAYRWPDGAVTPKITIASWDASYISHEDLREQLGDGWGGPRGGTITGSPMGRAPTVRPSDSADAEESTDDLDRVLWIVGHLLRGLTPPSEAT